VTRKTRNYEGRRFIIIETHGVGGNRVIVRLGIHQLVLMLAGIDNLEEIR